MQKWIWKTTAVMLCVTACLLTTKLLADASSGLTLPIQRVSGGTTTVVVDPQTQGLNAVVGTGSETASAATQVKIDNWISSASIGFIENKGQIADQKTRPLHDVLFKATIRGASVYVTKDGLTHVFTKREEKDAERDPAHSKRNQKEEKTEWCRLDMKLEGANISQKNAVPSDPISQLGVSNYYLSGCPNGVISLPTYSRITFKDIYPGIDWVLFSDDSKGVQQDFIVHPGANPADIQMIYNGARKIEVSGDNSTLRVQTSFGQIQEGSLSCYESESAKQVHGAYLTIGNRVSFAIDPYDDNQTLVIDPPLLWGTFYGGSGYDGPRSIYFDNATNDVYVAGYTGSPDMPVQNPGGGTYYQGTLASGSTQDAFVWRFTQGGVRIWATYYGGNGTDVNHDLVTDNAGNVYICGNTDATNLPLQTMGAAYYQGANAGVLDGYILKFNSAGVRQWATYYGGSEIDIPYSLAVGSTGSLFVTGFTFSTDLPTVNPGGGAYFQGSLAGQKDVFILKFTALGVLQWSTYYGGSSSVGGEEGQDEGQGIVSDANGLYVTGWTSSSNFPVLNPGGGAYFQGALNGWRDAFVLKFTNAGVPLWATFYGGSAEDYADDPATDGGGNLYVNGYTTSTDLPTQNPGGSTYFQGSNGGSSDLFILKFNSSGVRQWATYYGGSGADDMGAGFDNAIATDFQNNLFLTGRSFSPNLPTMNPGGGSFFQGSLAGMSDAFILEFNSSGTQVWGSYYGSTDPEFGTSITVDKRGCVYATGEATGPTPIPLADPGGGAYYQSTSAGSDEGYIIKFCTQTGACCIDTTCFQLASALECQAVGGTNFQPGTSCTPNPCNQLCNICGTKFLDKNKNGIQDGGEQGLPGWTIQLYYFNDGLVATTTTGANGSYCFNNVPCASYTVKEVMQQNWVQTYPSPNGWSFSLAPNSTYNGVNFGNSDCALDTCCVKPPNGLIAWYPLDETSPAIAYDVATGAHNGVDYCSSFASVSPGKVGNAYQFGFPNYIRVYNDPFVQIDSGDFSIDCWVKPSSFGAGCPPSVTYFQYKPCGDPIVDNRLWGLWQNSTTCPLGDNGVMFYTDNHSGQGKICLTMQTCPSPTDSFESASTPLTTGQWQHIAVTVQRKVGTPLGTFYYNGANVGTFTPLQGLLYGANSPCPQMNIGHANVGLAMNCGHG